LTTSGGPTYTVDAATMSGGTTFRVSGLAVAVVVQGTQVSFMLNGPVTIMDSETYIAVTQGSIRESLTFSSDSAASGQVAVAIGASMVTAALPGYSHCGTLGYELSTEGRGGSVPEPIG
jgi:hypothetical protein